jgi:hypothetical protein
MHRTMSRRGIVAATGALVAALAVALVGCATQLRPAPEAVMLPGPGQAAVAEAAGVRIVASADAWRGDPEGLERVVTPMLVRVENDGAVAVQVRYEDFALVAADGRRFVAIPPFNVRGVVSTLDRGGYPVYGFGVSPFYPHLAVAPGIYPFDPFYPFYYDPYWPYWHRWVTLPTGDMVQKALPEGVLQPGGRATGFLYFEDVAKARRVTFEARLPVRDADNRTVSVTIPFVVD